MSADGNDRPTSTMRMRPSSSMQAMLRPTSPTPPRKTTRTFGSEETGVLQRLADPRRAPPPWRGRAAAAARRPAGPSISRAAFNGIGLLVTNSALNSGDRSSWIFRAAGHVPRLDQLDHLADLRTHQVAGDADDARPRPGRRSRTSPSRRRSTPRSPAAPRPSAETRPGSHRWSPSPRRCWAARRARAACRARCASRCGRGCCRR